MNWQETVMSDEELGEIIRRNQTGRPFKNESGIARDSTQAQAQATWEARQPEVDEAEQRGIKEVVEWIEGHHQGLIAGQDIQAVAGNECGYGDVSHLLLPLLEWQVFLKEHNID